MVNSNHLNFLFSYTLSKKKHLLTDTVTSNYTFPLNRTIAIRMVDPVCAYSQLYHVAFQNTMKKAMFFIDRQLQDWTSLTKYNFPDQHRRITGDPHHPYSTSTTTTTTTTTTLTSDSFTPPTHTNNDRQHGDVMYDDDITSGTQTTSTLSAPSDIYSLSHSSSSQQYLLPTQYHTLLTSEPKKLLHQQPIPPLRKTHTTKPRPLSMPILPVQQSQRPQTPPPLYCSITSNTSNSKTTPEDEDPYIRATRKWQNRRSCIILPREEEGREDLPPYHCSVYKMAMVNIKMERNSVGKKISRRPWRRVYIELWGTVLRIYPLTWFWATISNEPTHTISLAGAEASRAVDYIKRPCVLRLTGHSGIQMLVQSSNVEEMMSWIEHIQAGINISLDLEERPMPKFLTLQPRRGVDTGILCARMAELERRREQRRRTQQEILA
ncbi:unnamed protein product [Absidia cylindrospora]